MSNFFPPKWMWTIEGSFADTSHVHRFACNIENEGMKQPNKFLQKIQNLTT